MEIATILSISIGQGYRHGKQSVLLNCQLEDPEDIREVEYLFPSGMASLPTVGDQVIIVEISPEYLVAIATNSGTQTVTKQGETSLYSNDGDTVKATLKLLKDGTISLNNGDSSAVKYEALKTEFDKLKTSVNDFIGLYNSHVHASFTAVPSTLATPSTADISNAKSESIRV